MAKGTLSTIDKCALRLLHRWVPKWYGAFYDPDTGLFYERLNKNFKPLYTGQRRLLSQCRQISVYAHAAIQPEARSFRPDIADHMAALKALYYVPGTGGWLFALDDKGGVKDGTYDLYAQAFVIFAHAHAGCVLRDVETRETAQRALDFIHKHFQMPDAPGFAEGLDENLKIMPQIRRHESHMHLLEACLFAYETWEDDAFLDTAREIVTLFFDFFYDADNNRLSEYYDADLKPARESGNIVLEPGHYCEWIWLLKRFAALTGETGAYTDPCANMLLWAAQAGWDNRYGGIYDELNDYGSVIADTKRIWPFTEALKAHVLMLDDGMDKEALKKRIDDMVRVFDAHYIDARGFWTEWLTRDLQPATDYMPGTTPYHVYFGIMEARSILQARGKSKSLTTGPRSLSYALRRGVSNAIRKAKGRSP